jgi:hypothetical protein
MIADHNGSWNDADRRRAAEPAAVPLLELRQPEHRLGGHGTVRRRRAAVARQLSATKGALGMLIGMMLTGAGLTLTIAAAQAYGMYDGTYRGNLIVVGNNGASCTKTAPVQMTVTDDKLTYNHLGHVTIIATISSDGSFSGSVQTGGIGTPQVWLQGRITGGAIQAKTEVGNGCSYHLMLKQFQ